MPPPLLPSFKNCLSPPLLPTRDANVMGVLLSIPEIDMAVDSDILDSEANGEKLGDADAPAKLLILLPPPMPAMTRPPPPLAKEAPVTSTLNGVIIADVAFSWMELSSKLMAVLESCRSSNVLSIIWLSSVESRWRW